MLREKIRYQLVNYQRNQVLLQSVPHRRYLDLAIVFYSEVPVPEEESLKRYGIVTWKGLESLGLCLEQLEELAAENTQREQRAFVTELKNLLEEGGEEVPFSEKIPMYVLSNQSHLFGAVCLLYPGLLQMVGEYLEADLYVLPSSVHECILVPAREEISRKALQTIVEEVNQTQVAEDEFLSNQVYLYKKGENRLLL